MPKKIGTSVRRLNRKKDPFNLKEFQEALDTHRKEIDKIGLNYQSYMEKYYGGKPTSMSLALDAQLSARNQESVSRSIWTKTMSTVKMATSLIEPSEPLPSPPPEEDVRPSSAVNNDEQQTYRSSGMTEELARLERENKALKYQIANLKAAEKQFIHDNEPSLREEKEKKQAALITFVVAISILFGMLLQLFLS